MRTFFDLLKVLGIVHAFDGDTPARVDVVVVLGALQVPLGERLLVQSGHELVEDMEITLALDLVHHSARRSQRWSVLCVWCACRVMCRVSCVVSGAPRLFEKVVDRARTADAGARVEMDLHPLTESRGVVVTQSLGVTCSPTIPD